jgi:lysozyme
MLTTSDPGVNVIKSFEGVALRAYRDSVGVWTIGYGLTNFDKNLPWKVQAGLTITMQEAVDWLHKSLADNYEPAVRKALPNATQPQFDAGTSFHYNTGAITKASWPKNLNAGDMGAARSSILSWNKAGGNVLAGLTRRRKREWAMIETGDYGPEGKSTSGVLITKNEDNGSSTGSTPKPTTPAGPGMLGRNDTGVEVKELQDQLTKLKLLPSGSSSGTFDDATWLAVLKFQGSHKQLTRDGVVGPATRNAILRDLQATGKAPVAAQVAVGAAISAGAAWKAVGAKVALGIVGVTGFVLVAGALYIGWHYRDELGARFNRLIGRTVP